MDDRPKRSEDDGPHVDRTAYEPPRVECVLTPNDLEREVQYAGTPPTFPT